MNTICNGVRKEKAGHTRLQEVRKDRMNLFSQFEILDKIIRSVHKVRLALSDEPPRSRAEE
jgi:hypothetical protein